MFRKELKGKVIELMRPNKKKPITFSGSNKEKENFQ
jgi:hypothetical protein